MQLNFRKRMEDKKNREKRLKGNQKSLEKMGSWELHTSLYSFAFAIIGTSDFNPNYQTQAPLSYFLILFTSIDETIRHNSLRR